MRTIQVSRKRAEAGKEKQAKVVVVVGVEERAAATIQVTALIRAMKRTAM